jgi:HAD superfamily hydrolase (TIGR01509 family)
MDRIPRAVIFDMDGLMLDTESLAARAWQSAAIHFDVEFDALLSRRMIGRNGVGCRELLAMHYGASFPVVALMDKWHEAYVDLIASEGLAVKPGLSELLSLLEAMRIPKAVATSTGRAGALSKLQQANLLDRFPVLVGGNEVSQGKPAPDIFLKAASQLGVPPGDCLVLEDSEPGVTAAWSARMLPIMIPDLHPPSDELLARGLLVMPSLHDVRIRMEAIAGAIASADAATREIMREP